jgi:hypothetical protein
VGQQCRNGGETRPPRHLRFPHEPPKDCQKSLAHGGVTLSKYRALKMKKPFFNGFKLFLDEDVDMFSPRVMRKQAQTRPADLSVGDAS